MFTGVPFRIAKTGKQPKCPQIGEWIKETCYIYTMEYYSAIKKNEVILFAATRIDLEIIIPSESVKQNKISFRFSEKISKELHDGYKVCFCFCFFPLIFGGAVQLVES